MIAVHLYIVAPQFPIQLDGSLESEEDLFVVKEVVVVGFKK